MLLLAVLSLGAELVAGELPRLPEDVDPGKQTYQEQKELSDLPEAYDHPAGRTLYEVRIALHGKAFCAGAWR
jgi:hypothetical protein